MGTQPTRVRLALNLRAGLRVLLRNTLPVPVLLAAFLLPVSAQTRSMFTCTTGDGRNLREAFPPRECAEREVRELNSDGSLRRVIPAPLTPEQKVRLAAEQRRQLEAEELARQQKRRDRALLEAYGSEDEIENARERALANRRALVARTEKRLDELNRERRKLDAEAEFYEKRTQPDKLKRAFENNAQLSRQEEKILADTKIEIQRIGERFDVEAKRFRDLVAAGATPVQRRVDPSADPLPLQQ